MREHFVLLDGMRGVAAVAVVTLHAGGLLGPFSFAAGYLAVDLFFIISGFVVDRAYSSRLAAGMSLNEFTRVRLLRLWPLFLLGLFIGVSVSAVGIALNPESGWTASSLLLSAGLTALYLPTLFGRTSDPAYPLNSPSWTLFFELLVNALYAAAHRMVTVSMLIGCVVLMGSGLLWCSIMWGDLDVGYDLQTFPLGLLRVMFGFSIGVLIARLRKPGMTSSSGLTGALLAILAVILVGGPAFGIPAAMWDACAVLLIFPVLVWKASHLVINGRGAAFALALGSASYALYATHVPLLGLLFALGRLFKINLAGMAPVSGLLVVSLLLIFAVLADHWFDRPLRTKLARALLTGKTTASAPPAA